LPFVKAFRRFLPTPCELVCSREDTDERGWIAEYRLAVQKGRVVVAGVRICSQRWAHFGDNASQSGERVGFAAVDVRDGARTGGRLR
jgi:hypothetical protein